MWKICSTSWRTQRNYCKRSVEIVIWISTNYYFKRIFCIFVKIDWPVNCQCKSPILRLILKRSCTNSTALIIRQWACNWQSKHTEKKIEWDHRISLGGPGVSHENDIGLGSYWWLFKLNSFAHRFSDANSAVVFACPTFIIAVFGSFILLINEVSWPKFIAIEYIRMNELFKRIFVQSNQLLPIECKCKCHSKWEQRQHFWKLMWNWYALFAHDYLNGWTSL